MSALGMRPPRPTGHPVAGFRVATVAALAAVVAVLGTNPAPAAAKSRKTHKAHLGALDLRDPVEMLADGTL